MPRLHAHMHVTTTTSSALSCMGHDIDARLHACSELGMQEFIRVSTHQGPLIGPVRVVRAAVALLAHCPGRLLLDIANLHQWYL